MITYDHIDCSLTLTNGDLAITYDVGEGLFRVGYHVIEGACAPSMAEAREVFERLDAHLNGGGELVEFADWPDDPPPARTGRMSCAYAPFPSETREPQIEMHRSAKNEN